MHEKVQCVQCHVKPVFTDVGKNCQDCHDDVHQRRMGTDCAQCHTVQGWNIAVQQVKEHQNRFPLLGAHAAVQCVDCHKQAAVGQFQGLSTACYSCHQTDYQKTTNPNHVTGGFPTNCDMCHTFDSWLGATFNHAGPPANFPLTGAHATAACATCHVNNVYTNFKGIVSGPNDCGNSMCHLTTWNQATNPKHSSAPNVFPVATCSTCHNTTSWTTATFDHSTTGFPLQNSHQMAPGGKVNNCTDCHINNNYNLTTQLTDCGNAGCHLNTNYGGGWAGTTNPVHSTAGALFAATNCANCHNTISFLTAAAFDHSTTGFPLLNSHQMAPAGKVNACTDCHINNNYTLAMGPTDCGNAQCHLSTNYGGGWQGTNNPVHSTAGALFAAANCANCHNTISFMTAAAFDHSTTGFPLTNSHKLAPAGKVNDCTDCHINNNYTLTMGPTDCGNAQCHLSTHYGGGWQGTTNPVHSTAGALFAAANCANCHNTISFGSSGAFDHSTTGFPLQNSHQMAPAGKVNACTDCHINNNYTLTMGPTDCGNAQCHLSTNYGGGWQGTNNPVHSTAGPLFAAANCSTCHNTISFMSSAAFDHSTTGFPLQNSHQMAPAGKVNACTDCHINNNYTLTTGPTNCGNAQCHLSTNYGGGWQGTTNPVHSTAGALFAAANCANCHNTISFGSSGAFDHSTTGFPLTNSHQMAPAGKVNACTDCHINNNYTLTMGPTDCGNAQCHLSTNYGGGWQGTNNPAHSTAGAPFAAANCSSCHNTISFLTATFDHSTTGFPLTGSHQLAPAGKVNLCSDCHTGNNYTTGFPPPDCGNSGCHLKDWNATPTFGGNIPNHITAGFPITQCATCHDTILWTDGKFDHSTTGFALLGPHMLPPRTAVTGAIGSMVNMCTDCHMGGNYSLSAMTCGACHATYFANAQNYGPTVPNHVTSGYDSQNCMTCHTTYATTAWLGAVFNHTFFVIPHHGSVCSDCHINAANYKIFSCENCHTVPTAHQPGMQHPAVCSPSPNCWYTPNTRCYDCHKG